MLRNPISSILVISFAAFLGAFTALWLLDFAVIRNGICNPNTNCFLDWLGATSGWAAAFAALITIMFLRYENRRREKHEWRRIVDSAELVRGVLEPQLHSVEQATKRVEDPSVLKWLIPSLEKSVAALNDPTNDEYRKASAFMRAKHKVCVRLCEQAIKTASFCVERSRAPQTDEAATLQLASNLLRECYSELQKIVASAHDPSDYLGY